MGRKIEIPFCAGAYLGRSRSLNPQRCVNWYPSIADQGSTSQIALYPTPGLSEFVDLGTDAVVRGLFAAGSYVYAVSGSDFFQIDSAGTATDKGNLTTTTGQCYMAYNGSEVLMVDGTKGYIFNIAAGTLTAIADADFPNGASWCAYIDGYFIVDVPNTATWAISALNDGTSWDALDRATAEGFPDKLYGLTALNREAWLFGNRSVEVWYNSGASFPFERRYVIPVGTAASDSVATGGNGVFWLGEDEQGQAVPMAAVEYQPTPIGTEALNYTIGNYTTISDAIGYCYQQDGHFFYVLTFPTEDATWVYDTTTQMWHERESLNTFSQQRNVWGRHRSNCHAFAFAKHLVGDYTNGIIYSMSPTVYADNATRIQRIRQCQVIHDNQNKLRHSALQVLFEPGVGLTTGQGSDPQAMLQWSDDGGHTWSNEYWRSIGQKGEYRDKAIWRKLGQSENRVYRLTVTDPVNCVIIGAYLEVA